MSDVYWALQAGREIDALVVERVMGWKVAKPEAAALRFVTMGDTLHPNHVPHYSTDIAAAWEVVEALRARFVFEMYDREDGSYVVKFGQEVKRADTAPLAICRAALAAVEDA